VRRIDVRIIAATNRKLPDAVADGTFREDLFFRLGMFAIGVPPLRERQADIRGLIRFFLGGSRVRHRIAPAAEIEPDAEELLLAYSWPGNVRELENVIARARILAEGACITVADLPPEVTRLGPAHPNGAKADGSEEYLRERVRKFEAAVIQGAVDDAGGDRRMAAQRLGISLSSLYRKLDELVANG
jgi:two-component system, NtrC family, response regulator AtoC